MLSPAALLLEVMNLKVSRRPRIEPLHPALDGMPLSGGANGHAEVHGEVARLHRSACIAAVRRVEILHVAGAHTLIVLELPLLTHALSVAVLRALSRRRDPVGVRHLVLGPALVITVPVQRRHIRTNHAVAADDLIQLRHRVHHWARRAVRRRRHWHAQVHWPELHRRRWIGAHTGVGVLLHRDERDIGQVDWRTRALALVLALSLVLAGVEVWSWSGRDGMVSGHRLGRHQHRQKSAVLRHG
mmetsp:Transcript_20483/g.61063  ORF Transcript_20483/g.61063 Transcript_20483/m.61063 type:complete len:243 (-) Transcript_20483:87-815(-)